jgi:hypothetical protein
MFMTRKVRTLAAATLTLLSLLSATPAAMAQQCESCATCQTCTSCNWLDCPPYYKHCAEGGPKICVKCACPKPVCCPSDAPNWGYYQRCWRPWPWGPNWSHCYGVPPASQIVPPMHEAEIHGALPTPRVAPIPH